MKSKQTLIAAVLTLAGLTNTANAQLPDPGAAIVEEGNGYESALVNFRFIANTVWTTDEAVHKINGSK